MKKISQGHVDSVIKKSEMKDSFKKVNEKGVSQKKKIIGKVLDGNKLFRSLRDKWNVVYKVSSTFPKGHSRICKNGYWSPQSTVYKKYF